MASTRNRRRPCSFMTAVRRAEMRGSIPAAAPPGVVAAALVGADPDAGPSPPPVPSGVIAALRAPHQSPRRRNRGGGPPCAASPRRALGDHAAHVPPARGRRRRGHPCPPGSNWRASPRRAPSGAGTPSAPADSISLPGRVALGVGEHGARVGATRLVLPPPSTMVATASCSASTDPGVTPRSASRTSCVGVTDEDR